MEPKAVICDKCGSTMKYSGVRLSGNTEYAVWKCSCGNEMLKCMGVNDD